ncbi:MAG TPA: tRNA (adenosine(37)-N6)-threonylcarbamoyltransferase complex ATPase subunit type 1 TsaE [bacterium]
MLSETETKPGSSISAASECFTSNHPEETRHIAANLAHTLEPGAVVALFGELGSGKTTFIHGLCEALRVSGDVTSPTFTLLHEYAGRLPVYHFDFYRIEHADDIWQLGWEDYFYGDGICLIEWADRILDFLPKNRIEISMRSCFEQGLPNRREIQILRK